MLSTLRAAFFGFLAALGLTGPETASYQGFVEGEYVLAAPQIGGAIETLNVERGQTVKAGDVLFILEHASETADLDEAEAKAQRAEAALADLIKAKRPPELDALTAQRDQAQAALRLAAITYERDLKQLQAKAVSQATVDADKAAMDQAKARLDEAEAALATGRLSVGRDDAIRAAQADVVAAQAALAQAQWQLDQKRVRAPADAFVFDTILQPGEFAATGQPVASLLPPSNIKVRFFVSEKKLSSLSKGLAVTVHVDGEERPRPAHVTYISPKAEYSPPQLYNRDNRERMLFMIEAVPDAEPQALHPGQPVDVTVSAP